MKRTRKHKVVACMLAAFMAVSAGQYSMTALAQTDSIGTNTLSNEFKNVPKEAKSRIRYWVPQAAMDDSDIKKDIKNIADMGYGEIEVVAITVFGNIGEENSWGTDNWNHKMKTVLQAAKEYGITVDFTNGPAWPIAMPNISSADDEAALYEMTYGVVDVPGGTTYQGIVPERTTIRQEGTTKLNAVLAYQKTADKTIDFNSRIDLTDQVVLDQENQANSTITFTAPNDEDWVLFSFFEQPATQKTSGYYVIDHIGQAGAQAAVDFWEQNLIPEIKDYLDVVDSIFCDSLEYNVAMEWTRGFEDIFYQQKGYDITPYLPIIGQTGTYPATNIAGYQFSDNKLTEQVKNDYFEVVSYCYNEYHLKPMQQMAEKYGLNLRYQVGYNKPFEVESAALYTGIPEGEALGRKSIDNLRAMSGAVHMGDKPQYSFEGAAEGGNCYGQTWEDLMWWLKRSWAGGVNMQTLHGAGYSGGYHGTGNQNGNVPGKKWPAFALFGGVVSNVWNCVTSPEQSSYYVDYMGRHNYILQKTAKMDVAVYRNEYLNDGVGGDGSYIYPDDGILNSYGYSYEFVSPTLLDLENATITNGYLDEEGPAYKAMVIHNQKGMPEETAEKLLSMVEQGFKLVFVGETPSQEMYYEDVLSGNSDEKLQQIIQQMLNHKNVIHVDSYDQVPQALEQLGVQPDADYKSPEDILPMHTTDENGDYYYLYNYNKVPYDQGASQDTSADASYPGIDKEKYFKDKTVNLTLEGEGKPYLLNAWTGEITPIAEYKLENGKVNLTLDFKGDEEIMIAILDDQTAIQNGIQPMDTYVESSQTQSGNLEYVDGNLVFKSTEPGEYQFQLNNGTVITNAPEVQSSLPIENWNLKVNYITAPENGSTSYYDSVWKESETIQLDQLKSWSEIKGIETVSGVGTYTATFNLEKGWAEGYGATIDLGDVEDSFTVTVNGTKVPFPNQLDTVVDIGPYVKSGENTIEVEVASTLYNTVNNKAEKISGLLGNEGIVSVRPYACVEIEETADKSILNSVIAYAEAAKESGEYDNAIESVQKSFDAALINAKAIAENNGATQAEVDVAWQTLLNEIHKLGFIAGDKTELASLIAAAEEINGELDHYVEAGKAEFTAALETAQTVYKNGDAMQAEINEVADNLLNAMLNLRFKADKSVLEDVLAEAGKVDANAYTAESYAALTAAVAEANAIMENENASQKEVDAAVTNVQSAMDSLVAVEGIKEIPSTEENTTQTGQEMTTTKANAAKTGDVVPIVGLTIIILAGTALLFARKKR
ncbi:MAG: hypothetical protein DBX37_02325 [Massilioclostridium sp.]|nr:MAG: hypothetical protein DBX37_02325 [Massilioclostridium sp.]